MISVGAQELREDLSKILQRVRDEGEVVEITLHGEAVARMVPLEKQPALSEESTTRFSDLEQLIEEISAHTKDNVGAVETVREMRREL